MNVHAVLDLKLLLRPVPEGVPKIDDGDAEAVDGGRISSKISETIAGIGAGTSRMTIWAPSGGGVVAHLLSAHSVI